MITIRRSVLLGLSSGAHARAAMETGVEFARLFQLPVHGLFVEEETAMEIYGFPAAFRPRGRGRPAGEGDPRRMAAALAREGQRLREELAGLALRARVEHSFAVHRGRSLEALSTVAGAGDLVVIAADLTDPGLGRLMAAASELSRVTGGVLLVPAARPSRTGPVVALTEPAAEGLHEVAAEIATALDTPLALVLTGVSAKAAAQIARALSARLGPRTPVEAHPLAEGARLDVEAVGTSGLRLLVSAAGQIDRIETAAPRSALRRFRAPLLVLHEEHAAAATQAGAAGRAR